MTTSGGNTSFIRTRVLPNELRGAASSYVYLIDRQRIDRPPAFLLISIDNIRKDPVGPAGSLSPRLSCLLRAQVVGASLAGTVRDESGAPLSGAKVVLTNDETGSERSLATDSSGHYDVASVVIGSYRITASKAGFASEIKTGISLEVASCQGSGGTSSQLLGVDAVREFNVVTDTYGAEYGKRPGAQVSIVTASGSNQVHGSVYEFLRNSALDARNFFDGTSIPQFQRNEFGGAIGGPIRKNRIFLFGNYEAFRQHLGLSDVTFVPDNVARADYNISDRDTLFGVYTVDDSYANTPSANPLSSVIETLREQVRAYRNSTCFRRGC